MSAAEVLPPGVGRVPTWWMEITPHYTLDDDDEEERRAEEDRMAFYFMQLQAAHEAGVLMPDGTPKLGPDLKPLSWTPLTPWNGRGTNGGAATDDATGGPGGRNFKPGQPVIDPTLFGILESDPDYQAYLTGAKLPPGYFEHMGRMLATAENGGTCEGILNNLKQTDYGRYGRQAEKPHFKPDWAKKKLRSTDVGANIRQGQYNDSPNKHIRRRVEAEDMPRIPVAEPAPKAAPVVETVQDDDDDDDDHEQLLREQQEKLRKLQELQRQLQQQKEQEERGGKSFVVENPFDKVLKQPSAAAAPHYEEEVEEEIVEDYTDGSYEEEIIEDEGELDDLHAILAAKQAELERLKAQL